MADNREVWENIYRGGHTQRYPWDSVVSFVFRNAPGDRARKDVRILEVGFGTASNLWFAAREGFSVYGVEGSPTAVEYARKRFAEEGLEGDLRVGDFTELPFKDNFFDLAIDRGSLTCVGKKKQLQTISEIHRVLKKGGRFHYNGYSDAHSSYRASDIGEDGVSTNIRGGTLTGIGDIYFASRRDVADLFRNGWKIISLHHRMMIGMLTPEDDIHAEWLVVAEKE